MRVGFDPIDEELCFPLLVALGLSEAPPDLLSLAPALAHVGHHRNPIRVLVEEVVPKTLVEVRDRLRSPGRTALESPHEGVQADG